MTEEQAYKFAFGEYLADFPSDLSSDEIFDLIEEGDESIIIWEPFENHSVGAVIEYITRLAHNVSLASAWEKSMEQVAE
jgi:hypothetical protein